MSETRVKNAVLYIQGVLLVVCALGAAWYSFNMSSDYVHSNLGGNNIWLVLAGLAIVIELFLWPLTSQILRTRQVIAIFSLPFLFALGVCAVGINVYLEGGKANLVLSDAAASRGIDEVVAKGHRESLQKLFATQQKYIDSRRIDTNRVNEINDKIKEQAKWARSTAVAGINPIITTINKTTGWSKENVELTFLVLIVMVPLLVRALFMHYAILFLTTPYRVAQPAFRERSDAPQKPVETVPVVETAPIVQTTEKPPEKSSGLSLVKAADPKKRLGMSLQSEQVYEPVVQQDYSENIVSFNERLSAKQKRKQRLEKKKQFQRDYDYDLSETDFEDFVVNNFQPAQEKPKGKPCADYYMNADQIMAMYRRCFPESAMSKNKVKKVLTGLTVDNRRVGKIKSNNVYWYKLTLRNPDLKMTGT